MLSSRSEVASAPEERLPGDGDGGDVAAVDRSAVPDESDFRDIHPLSTPGRGSVIRRSASASTSEFTSLSHEFTALVAAAAASSSHADVGSSSTADGRVELSRIREAEEELETEMNALAIVPDVMGGGGVTTTPPEPRVRKEETEAKISAWQTAEIAKINNRFKREEVVINGWENGQVEKATTMLAKIERRLAEERAKSVEKAENEMAKARRKAEERRASAAARRGVKVAKVTELADFMRAVGRVPSKRSFFFA